MATVRFQEPLRELVLGPVNLNPLDWRTARAILALPEAGGLFRIRWNPNSPNTFSERHGGVNVSYGFGGNIVRELFVTSYPDDILYIGKSQNIRTLVMSITRPSAPIGREILELIRSTHPTLPYPSPSRRKIIQPWLEQQRFEQRLSAITWKYHIPLNVSSESSMRLASPNPV